MSINKSIIIIFFCLVANNLCYAQNRSNTGKEFWMSYGFDYTFFNEVPVNSQELAIYISAEQAATVTVTVTNTGYTQTLNIPANTVDASILIPKSGPNDARTLTDGLQNRGIHIVSNVPVAVYAHVYANQVSGATMLMPVETYGYIYNSINYYQTTSQSNPNDWYSWFYVIASEDNTRVDITPSDSTKNGWLPNQTYTINLNKGESYHVFGKAIFNVDASRGSKDMTGSKIVSVVGGDGNCHPVALFSGSGGIRLCRGDGGEFMQQQVFPAQAWGTRYLTYHTINNANTDILQTNRNIYRVCVSDPTTLVKKNGIIMTGLIKNFFYEYMDSTGGDYIEANKPILVAQYMVNKNQCWNFPTTTPSPPSYGDPEMFYLSPIEQGQKAVLFYTSRKSTIDYVYANIHLPTAAIASLRVDGNIIPPTQIILHPNYPNYCVALVRFVGAAAQHKITADSAFTGTAYGLGNYESYGYNFGTNINNLNSYTQIKNSFNTSGNIDTITCPKTPFRLYAKLAYPASSIHWKLSQVTGLFPNTDSIISSPFPLSTEIINGRTYYIYTLQQNFTFSTTGTFNIPITYTTPAIPNCNQTENTELTIVVKPGPIADFSFTNPVCLKDSVYFTANNTSNGFNLTNYLWFFADATTANTANTVKKFNTPGTQNVGYRIFADNGCASDTIKAITIFDSPIAKLGISSNIICARDSVLISDTSSIAIGTISNWRYDFGDGITINRTVNTNFHHQYTTPGNYTIKLIVSSNNSCKSDTVFKSILVNPTPNSIFGFDRSICVNDSIRFTDTSTIAVGNIVSWYWNFGDGNTTIKTNNAPFYHQYTTTGNFVVSLICTSNNGCKSDTTRKTVNVNNKPIATFTLISYPCVDSVFKFTSSYTTNNNTTWHWSFGDGQFANSTANNTTTHTYANALTNVSVKHVVNLGQGCVSDTITKIIPLINENPIAQFNIDDDTLCVNTPLQFTSTLIGNYTWNWDFGNGLGNNIPTFIKSYNNAGTYTVTLKLIDANGCGSNIVNKQLIIKPNPTVNVGIDAFIQTGTSITLNAIVNPTGNYNYLWSPSTYLNDATIVTPNATPSVTTTYLLKAIDPISNCYGEDEIKISVIDKLYIPTAFTPNKDGVNDTWELLGLALYPNAVVTIYNRWGQKILDAKNYYLTPWNGTFNGKNVPSGTYIYVIQLNNTAKEITKGTLMVIR
jgi:gliding motility-associated-like protein